MIGTTDFKKGTDNAGECDYDVNGITSCTHLESLLVAIATAQHMTEKISGKENGEGSDHLSSRTVVE